MAARRGFAGTFWPTAQQELLLQATLLGGDAGERAWTALRPTLDVERLEQGSVVLLPLLYERLMERGASEHFLPRLKGVRRFVWYRNQVGLDAVKTMLNALNEAEVQTIVFGDGPLILNYYRRLGVRPLDQPAVLVRPHQLELALDALARAGWHVTKEGSGGHRLLVPNRALPSQQRIPLRYALYWRFLLELESLEDRRPEDALWRRTRETDVNGTPAATLGATHELLRICVAGARAGGGILWIADALTILNTSSAEIDWDELMTEARRLRCVLRVRDAFAYLADALDAPIPHVVQDQLAATTTSDREQLAHRIAGRGGRLLGSLPSIVGAHVVARQNESTLRIVLTLPRFLRAEWGLDHVWQIPVAALRRAALARRARQAHASARAG